MNADTALDLGWILAITAWIVCEAAGIALNERRDLEGKPRSHRTFTELARWLFATDKAGARARYRGLRRFAGIAAVGWLAVHFMVENWV